MHVTVWAGQGDEPERIEGDRPEMCPDCGRQAPIVVERRIVIDRRDDGPQ
jgi:hypothetical protein